MCTHVCERVYKHVHTQARLGYVLGQMDLDFSVEAYIAVAYILMAYIVMAYIVMAYIAMARWTSTSLCVCMRVDAR